jgi:ATP-dependent DNA ligase
MSDEERNNFWNNKKKFVGRIIEFKAQEKTKDFRYRHPVFVRMREDKNATECIF